MSPDPAAAADPLFVLSAWAGGVALAGAAVTARRVVGPGFTWLAAAVVGLIGLWSAVAGSVGASIAVALTAVGGLAVKRSRALATAALAGAGALLAATAITLGGPLLALTALVALGGITAEMMLGHWYLVDPTLSRGVLRALAGTGLVGAVADPVAVHALFDLPVSFGTAVHWALAITTSLLMVGVLGALRHPAYSGVMAATGLSYLAVLTGLAAVFVGRLIAAGAGPFA